MDHCYVEESEIVEGPRALPECWRHVSGLPALDPAELVALGWLPVIDDYAQLGPRQRYGAPVLNVESDQIVRHWPAESAPTPASVSMRQARLSLLAGGYLPDVDAAIDSLPEPQRGAARIEWDYASEVERASPLVALMGSVLGLSDEQLDDLFIQAAAL